MDEEYDKCSNLMAQAQLSGFDKEWFVFIQLFDMLQYIWFIKLI